jgi:hypothetical protein
MIKRKNWITGALLMSLALPIGATTVLAQTSQPSAKVTAKTSALTLLPETTGTGDWKPILSNKIKTSNQKDLIVGVSLEVGLYTRTLAKSKNMTTDSSTARGIVQVRVLVDGTAIEPGAVVFGRRSQTLNATLEGAIASCLTIVTDPITGVQSLVLDPTCVTAEEIELILETMDAAAFNFVAPSIPQGVHTVTVEARVDTAGSADQGSFEAKATVGKGSMTVESVRMIRGEDVVEVQ